MLSSLMPLIKSVITDENLKSINENLRSKLKAYELIEGEIGPFYAISPGAEQVKVQVITLKEVEGALVYGRCIEQKTLAEVLQVLMEK